MYGSCEDANYYDERSFATGSLLRMECECHQYSEPTHSRSSNSGESYYYQREYYLRRAQWMPPPKYPVTPKGGKSPVPNKVRKLAIGQNEGDTEVRSRQEINEERVSRSFPKKPVTDSQVTPELLLEVMLDVRSLLLKLNKMEEPQLVEQPMTPEKAAALKKLHPQDQRGDLVDSL